MQQLLGAAGEDLDVSFASASVGPAPAGDSLILRRMQLCVCPSRLPTMIKLAVCVDDGGEAMVIWITHHLAVYLMVSPYIASCCGSHENGAAFCRPS